MALPTSQHNVTVRKLSSTLNSYNTKVNTKLGGKADKVSGATSGDLAALDANGNLTDSGKKASDFATSAQGTKADSAIQGVKVNGTALTPDSTNVVNITKTSLGLNNVTNDAQVKRTEMGAANGVATLDSNGKIPTSQIPGSYDDVKEGYLAIDGKFYEDAQHTIEIPAANDKVYVDIPTNKTYRWSGTQYVVIGSDLALGETSSTAYRGDRGKTAYDHSQLTSGNPHHVTKSDVGLGNVDNKSEATIKSDFTGAVAENNTEFPTGHAVFEAIAAAGKGEAVVTSSNTFAEVQAIYTAGRLPVYEFVVQGTTFRLPLSGVYLASSSFTFSGTCGIAGKKLFQISINSSGWGTLSEKNIETEDDLVTSWSSTTSDSKYPSEKLVKDSLDNKVDKVSGKQLSTEDYTTAEKTKLAGISAGANKVVVDDNTGNGYIQIDGTSTAVYTHPTTAGNKHIPSGGSSGQLLGYDSAGTAKWVGNPVESISDVKIGFGAASATSNDGIAFTVSLSNYTLNAGNGGIVAIKFSNEVLASATLNINSKGAKIIYYQGAAITAGVVHSGDTAFLMYNGTQYVLLGTDRSVQEMTDTEVTDLVNALT